MSIERESTKEMPSSDGTVSHDIWRLLFIRGSRDLHPVAVTCALRLDCNWPMIDRALIEFYRGCMSEWQAARLEFSASHYSATLSLESNDEHLLVSECLARAFGHHLHHITRETHLSPMHAKMQRGIARSRYLGRLTLRMFLLLAVLQKKHASVSARFVFS